MQLISTSQHREPWNKGKVVGQKAPFKLKGTWAIRTRLQMAGRSRDLALFDLGIDSTAGLRPGQSYVCAIFATAIRSPRVRSSCNKKSSDRFSLRSRLPRVRL